MSIKINPLVYKVGVNNKPDFLTELLLSSICHDHMVLNGQVIYYNSLQNPVYEMFATLLKSRMKARQQEFAWGTFMSFSPPSSFYQPSGWTTSYE